MRLKLALLFTAVVFPILIYALAPQAKNHSPVATSTNETVIQATPFVIDEQSTVEYWVWQRQDMLPVNPVVWVMPGIGGPGGIIDDEAANTLIEIIKSRYVDQIVIVQLRGHSLASELSCSTNLDFDECISLHQANGLDLTNYHYLQYAQDVIQLRKYLGIKQWHAWGTSYGGRVATAMAMLDPEGMSSLLLDSAIAFAPEDSPSHLKIRSELLHKLYAACEVFDDCFENQNGSLEQLAQFIVDYETPSHQIYGVDFNPITKTDWIDTLTMLMYSESYELAIEWVLMHINHPDGFLAENLSSDLRFDLVHMDAKSYNKKNQTWSINIHVTLCNESISQNTMALIDYGVYGSELDRATDCWPRKDWSNTQLNLPDIPVMIVHFPFDNVVTVEDAQSYLKYWPYAQWCTVLQKGHTLSPNNAAKLITNISVNHAFAPNFCHSKDTVFFRK